MTLKIVFLYTALIQVGLLAAIKYALNTLDLFLLVDLHMLIKIGATCKGFITVPAFKRSLSSMDSFVSV